MTLCPVAIVASCKKCPMFRICPGKGIIGDHRKAADEATKAKSDPQG